MSRQSLNEWRCRNCGTLLGIRHAGRMHIKYKRVEFTLAGHVRAVCPRCSADNEARTDGPSPNPSMSEAAMARA